MDWLRSPECFISLYSALLLQKVYDGCKSNPKQIFLGDSSSPVNGAYFQENILRSAL